MYGLITNCLHDPLMTLSTMQAATYLASSIVVRYGHEALWRCHALSTLIYIGFAVTHYLALPH